jgi:hypothetical protein
MKGRNEKGASQRHQTALVMYKEWGWMFHDQHPMAREYHQ